MKEKNSLDERFSRAHLICSKSRQIQSFMPGDGDLLKAVFYSGLGCRANKKIASCKWFVKRNGDSLLPGN